MPTCVVQKFYEIGFPFARFPAQCHAIHPKSAVFRRNLTASLNPKQAQTPFSTDCYFCPFP